MDEAACEICGHEDAERGLYDACSMCSSTVPLATEPEPDMLEPLRRMLEAGGIANPRHREKVADAMAEIERLGRELSVEKEFKAQASEARNTAQAQLRAITEAKPVGFQYRWNKDAHWSTGFYHDIEHYRRNPEYEVRRLLVAPKGDTEE